MNQNPLARSLGIPLFAALFLLYLPTWRWLGEAWLSDPYYTHGPLVLIVSLYLLWAHRPTVAKLAPAPSRLGWPYVAVGLAVHLWATLWHMYYISALMFPVSLFGLVLVLSGWKRARLVLFPILFLVLMVPLPLAERVGPVLEGWTASAATLVAQGLGIAASHTGSQVNLPNSTSTAGIPIGGTRSAIAILTLAALLAYIAQGRVWARVAIFLAAVPIALVVNTVRIALLFAMASRWDADVAMTFFQYGSGPVLFLCGVALLLIWARVLRCSTVRWQVVLPQ